MENRTKQKSPASDPMERFVGGLGDQIFNRDLLCARCTHLWEDETAECEVYEQKPLAVLRGEDVCPEFISRVQDTGLGSLYRTSS